MSKRLDGRVLCRTWTDKDGEEVRSWRYVIELAKVDSKRRQKTRAGFRTKKDAEHALRDELNARERGSYVAPNAVSLADFVNEQWLPSIEARRRATTYDLYARMARLHILPTLGAVALQDVRPLDVERLYLDLAKGSRGQPLGDRSLHNVATVLHGALEQAVRWEKIRRNPAAGVTPPQRDHADEGEPAHWTSDEVAAFLDRVDEVCGQGRSIDEKRQRKNGTTYTYHRVVAPDPMARALWYLVATTGMRRGEACGLRWEDLDETRGVLTIRRARVAAGRGTVESAPKTRRGRRVIALDPATLEVLGDWRRVQRRERLRYGEAWEDKTGLVFTHTVLFTQPVRHGVPIAPRWVSGAFRKLAGGAELPALHLHGLRHSWATAAFEAGEHLRAVADHLGHADTAVTDRVYTHTVRPVQDTTAQRVAALFTSKRAGYGDGHVSSPLSPRGVE